ncbi:MAG: aminotransferase class V-fold PLP-dependent enzyme [Candidatus Lokiarchaeota archaeon]|nr:aminotransferase class V-fold PLP-dependent enzyme [Candidatus Lokiarchaeota archaeon]
MGPNWAKIREEEFPSFKNVINLKSAGGSPISKSAYESGIKYFNDMLNYGDLFWDEYFRELNSIREKIAKYFNSKPSEIAFLINTSSGMNTVARLLKKGETIYPEGEFPTSIHIFKRLGFKCEKIHHVNNKYRIKDIQNSVKESTKYLIHSHVQYLTGFKQDLERLGNLSRNEGLMNIINATQSFGAFPLDIQRFNIDILVASALKWACCGYGIGILFIKEKIIKENEIPFSSWLSVIDAMSMNNDNIEIGKETKFIDGMGGTPHFPTLLTLKGGLNLIEKIGNGDLKMGFKRISNRIIELTSEFINHINELDFKVITPLEIENRSGIITVEHKNAEEIYNELIKNKIYISLRNYPESSKKNLLRFSFNYYNNFEDIEKSISILKKIK